MKNRRLILFVVVLLIVSLSCNFLFPSNTNIPSNAPNAPVVDFETPAEPLNVIVQFDDASTARSTITPTGGSLSLTAPDGSVFTLEVPAEALAADTLITMTVVKSLEGAPLDNNAPAAVQLEPSGLFFSEVVTLTIIPAREIPIENQIIFGYEGDGQDYHLALVDPKSKEIKIKLMEFSGAGVGSGGDAQWAANLQVQANTSSTRLMDKLGEAAQTDRRANVLEGDESSNELGKIAESILDQFYDQVVVKEMAAAELDCQYAQKAIDDLLKVERLRQLFLDPTQSVTIPDLAGKLAKLSKIRDECMAAYRIVGGLDDWQTDTSVCDIMKPFTLTSPILSLQFSGGLSGTYSYSGGPFNATGGDSYTISLPDGVGKPGTMTGGGTGCVDTPLGTVCNGGAELYTLTPLDPGASCTQ